MQGYGFAGRIIATALGAIALLTTAGCAALADDGRPSAIVIPETNALITESAPTTVSTSVRSSRTPRSYAVPAEDTYAHLIGSAPRVGVADFRVGATSPAGERADRLSGVHFSTPDRSIRCSTGNNSTNALVCASEHVAGPAAAGGNAPAGCLWDRHLAVLNADGAAESNCANLYPVLYRSHILEYNSTILARGYQCLSEVEGLFCLDTKTDYGFAITRSGYESFRGDDPVPSANTARTGGASADSTHNSPVPTR